MTTTSHRILLGTLGLVGLYVGIWAAIFPLSFYESFPGPFAAWIALDGPFNEHLVRDVGALNLGLAAASGLAARSRDRAPGRAVALAWVVYSTPHLAYHLFHLGALGLVDAVGQVVSLSSTLLLALPLLVTAPARRAPTTAVGR